MGRDGVGDDAGVRDVVRRGHFDSPGPRAWPVAPEGDFRGSRSQFYGFRVGKIAHRDITHSRHPSDVTFEWHTEVVEPLSHIPDLLVGFDVESTGLDTANDEAISYGFAVFRQGVLVDTEEFFVLPDVQIHPGAEKVHGISYEHLRKKHREGDALSSRAGATRAAARLRDFISDGATFVGANPMFDWSMLNSTLCRHNSEGLSIFGIDLSSLAIVDVVKNDLALEPDRSKRPRRGLAFLCEHYGVRPGHHEAAEDARAAGEVLVHQVGLARQLPSEIVEATPAIGDSTTSRSTFERIRTWTKSLFAR